MKKRICIAAAVVVAVLAACGIIWWCCASFFSPREGTEQGVDVSTVFYRTDPNRIDRIELEGADSYTLVRADGVWSVENRPELALSEEQLTKLVENAASLHAADMLDGWVTKAERADFLKRRIGRVTVSGGGEKLYTLLIGGSLTEAGNYPVMLEGKNDLYEMYADSAQVFLQPLNELRDRRIHSIDGDKVSRDRYIQTYQVQRPDKPLLSIRAKTEEEMRQSDSEHSYFMQSPYIREVDTEQFEQQILVKLSMLTVKNFTESDPADLSVYGLAEEERTVLRVTAEDQVLVLYAGQTQGSERYMQKEGSPEVFTVDSEAVSFLETDPFFLLEPSLDMPPFEEISRLEIRGTLGNFDISVSAAESGGLTCRVGDHLVGEDRLRSWYRDTLSGLTVTGVLDAATAETGADVIVTAVYASTGNQHTVRFYPVNDLQYAVYINEEHGFSIEKKQIEQMMEELKNL